jgi:hypothetical protein
VVAGDRIVVFPSRRIGFERTVDIELLILADGSGFLTTYPERLKLVGAAFVDGRAFGFGGLGREESKRRIYSLDATSNTWVQQAAELPSRRHGVRVVVIGPRAYILGGFQTVQEGAEFDPSPF